GDLTLEVLKHLSKTGFDIQLARYTQKDFENLQAALKKDRDRIIKSITIKEEGILDWRYPSRILDVKKTFEMKGKDFATLRNKFNKVANNKEYQVVPLSDPEAEKVIRSTIFHWLSSLAYIGRETGANTSMFYETLLENIKHSPEMFDGFAIKTDKEAIGFVVWDVSGETANALAGLNQRRIPGLSEFQVVQACKMLNERGVKKYNLGGSETESLDKYKLKFHPVESVKMFSCDVDFDKNKKLPFEMINVIGGKDGLDL
ncbi:MAG: DUF2156 domain-containing protein, partial [Alphaproteobacteria bacterium]|nr:DUF2156 domain-containing protein [Alphaproteobacteria bacterium]